MIDVEAFILIGGKSSRLGVDKAFVQLDGKSLMDRAVETLRGALPEARVTAVAASQSQFAIKAITSGIPFIFDLYEGRGPLGGLHAALALARSPWIFLLACDYPFVSADLIQLLASKISDESGAVVPLQKDGRMQPLCAFYRVESAIPLIAEILERPRSTPPVHEIVDILDPQIVQFEEYAHLSKATELFTNINTPADLESLIMHKPNREQGR